MEWAYLKSREYYLTVEPNTTHVQTDRTKANGWELVQIDKLADGRYSVKFWAAKRMWSVQPNGLYETRPDGTVDSWERHLGGRIEAGPQAGKLILSSCVVEPAPAP